jgi:zinc transport system substrate-binding protein
MCPPAKTLASVLLSTAVLAVACGERPREQAASATVTSDEGPLDVYVVNYPLQYFAQRIGGDWVQVEFPAPADVDPVYWTPEPEVVSAYQSADLILLNGASYAGWIEMTSLPASKMVNSAKAFEADFIYFDDAVTHSHGPEGGHSHGETAFTTWLDPTLALKQAEAIRAAFAEVRPQSRDAFLAGLDALKRDLLAIDERLAVVFAGWGDRPLLGSHPVYQYLARRYDLNLRSVHFEPDEMPDGRAWRELQGLLREHPAKWMIWEAAPTAEIAERLQELGVATVVVEPCGNVPEVGDYLSVMDSNVKNLEIALGER